MKKLISVLLSAALLLCGCGVKKTSVGKDGLTVVATLFPTYDFARSIAGGRADITLLLTPGKESHSYEPSTGDAVRINNCDIFIYTGEYMEPWAEKLISAMDGGFAAVDASAGAELEMEHEHEHSHEEAHRHEFDPHIWTSPKKCLTIVDNILAAFTERDPANADYYKSNAEALKAELEALDAELREITAGHQGEKLYHGGRFSMHYFTEEYGLECEAAYDSCSSDTEPSVRKICSMIDEMRAEKTSVIFYEELSNNAVAKLIADETGAKPLLLHSCHNLTNAELEAGATYVSLMKQNAENLREALK